MIALTPRRSLYLILLLALLLRLGWVLQQDTLSVYVDGGGDSSWYLANGYGLFTGREHGWVRDITFYVSAIPTAPLYLIFVGFWQVLLPDATAIIVIRILQCLMGVATCYFAYRMTCAFTDDERAGIISALVLAIYPNFVMESSVITTETLYMFLLAAGMWLYMDWVMRPTLTTTSNSRARWLIFVGIAFGLATLTRATALLFPLGIFIHLLLVGGRQDWRKWLKRGLLLLMVYGATISIWTVYNAARWNRFVIGSDQMMPALWRGTTTAIQSQTDIDVQFLGTSHVGEADNCVDCKVHIPDEAYLDAARETITNNITGYLLLRLTELTNAYLQPHGVAELPGVSLRELALNWLQKDRSWDGLMRLIQGDYFWTKSLMYVIHYIGIIAGLVGMWLYRKKWQIILAPIGFIVYTTLMHLVLFVVPRYLFPIEPFYWIFASATFVWLYQRRRSSVLISQSLKLATPTQTDPNPLSQP